MKVLLTGAFGNLGSLVVEELLDREHRVVAFDVPSQTNRKVAKGFQGCPNLEIVWGDIRDEDRVASLVHRADAVIHLAAVITPFSEIDPALAHAVNVGGTENILQAIRTAATPPLMVFGSSISVFGPRKKCAPLCTPRDELVRTDHYSGHKIHCEKRVQELESPWAILRLAGMVDSRMRHRDPRQARMAFALAPDSPVEFVHPRDAATALANVLERPEAHGRIHLIGGGKGCQVTTLRMIQAMMGAIGIAITADDLGDEPTYAPWLDTTESERLLSFQRHTVEDFERECYERFKVVRPLVRPLSPLIAGAMRAFLRGSKAPGGSNRASEPSSPKVAPGRSKED
jgi:nucleoside-diphosphate-sugar epimerase